MPRKSKQQIETDKQKLKDKILTDLYLQKPPFNRDNLRGLISKMCKKAKIGDETLVYEDIHQTVFLELCKKPADFIIELYTDNPRRLIGLFARIAQLKGFASDDKYPELPSHSIRNTILHTSNFNRNSNLQADVNDWNDDVFQFIKDETPLPDQKHPDTWIEVSKHLNDEELETVNQELYGKKLRGKSKRNEEHKRKLTNVKRKIKRVVKKNKIEL